MSQACRPVTPRLSRGCSSVTEAVIPVSPHAPSLCKNLRPFLLPLLCSRSQALLGNARSRSSASHQPATGENQQLAGGSHAAKQSFAPVRSQAELGNENYDPVNCWWLFRGFFFDDRSSFAKSHSGNWTPAARCRRRGRLWGGLGPRVGGHIDVGRSRSRSIIHTRTTPARKYSLQLPG